MGLAKYTHKDGREVIIDDKNVEKAANLKKAGYKLAGEEEQEALIPEENPFADETKFAFHTYQHPDRHGWVGWYVSRSSNEVVAFLDVDDNVLEFDDLDEDSRPEARVDYVPEDAE